MLQPLQPLGCSLLPACLTPSLDSHPSGLKFVKLGKSSNFYVFASQLLCVIELIIIIIINNTTTIFNIIIVITIALHCNGRILNKNCNKSFFYQKFHVGGHKRFTNTKKSHKRKPPLAVLALLALLALSELINVATSCCMPSSLHFESWNYCAASLFNLNSDPSIIIIIVIVIIGNQYQYQYFNVGACVVTSGCI